MGESMAPTYGDREIAIASTDVRQVDRGDIVVIKRGEGTIIKRVAHVAGDSIDYYKVGGFWQCGLEMSFYEEVLNSRFERRQVQVPEGYVFVLGDNYLESQDSRQFGMVPVSSITAKLSDSRPRVPVPGEKARFLLAAKGD